MPLMLLCLVVTAPFTDVHKRFSVDLPATFAFTPLPGDTEGASFTVKSDGMTGRAAVRIFPVGKDATTEHLASELRAIVAREPNFRELSVGACDLGGRTAICRRAVHDFTVQGRTLTKMFEDAALVNGDSAYVVHTESLAEVYATFERDFAAFRAALRFAALAPEASVPVEAILGTWVMVSDGKTQLVLNSDGSFRLAEASGTFGVQGSSLLMLARGGTPERFSFVLQEGELVLRSDELPEPMRYRRPVAKTKSKRGKK